jgi:hypothetical protein
MVGAWCSRPWGRRRRTQSLSRRGHRDTEITDQTEQVGAPEAERSGSLSMVTAERAERAFDQLASEIPDGRAIARHVGHGHAGGNLDATCARESSDPSSPRHRARHPHGKPGARH